MVSMRAALPDFQKREGLLWRRHTMKQALTKDPELQTGQRAHVSRGVSKVFLSNLAMQVTACPHRDYGEQQVQPEVTVACLLVQEHSQWWPGHSRSAQSGWSTSRHVGHRPAGSAPLTGRRLGRGCRAAVNGRHSQSLHCCGSGHHQERQQI